MTLQTIVDSLISDTLQISLPLFLPELVICATIVVMLLVRVFRGGQHISPFLLAMIGTGIALWVAVPKEGLAAWSEIQSQELFTGMLVYDTLTAYLRIFLLSFAVLMILLSQMTGLAGRQEAQDFYVLVLGATLGMCIMASANHMLTVFLAIEMASVPSYVLAGIVKGRRRSSEASLKYAIYGAGTAGVMLYGISLLCGLLGTAHLPTMARQLIALNLPELVASGESLTPMVLALGGLMLGVGLFFKLSAVPFHFWCPDVFEGASAEVGAFLSVASKAAAMALLVRVVFGLSYSDDSSATNAIAQQPNVIAAAVDSGEQTPVVQTVAATIAAETDAQQPSDPLAPVRSFIVILISIVAVVSCTFGNLAAYGQTNIKRMLAYSTIAHAGFMMMAVAAAVSLLGSDLAGAKLAISSLLLYIIIYLFMNLGAFSIVAFLRNEMHSEELKDYAGLIRRCPVTVVMMTAILVSLIGLPPLAGFWPKLRVLQALYTAGGPLMMFVLVVAAFNTAISLVYYLRVAKTMCMDPEPDTRGPVSLGLFPATYILLVALPVLILGILPHLIAPWAQQAAAQLFG